MSLRVYVPATPALLADWLDAGAVPAGAERFVAPDSSEEAEYDALMAAAAASAALLAGPGRRVVAVAEVAAAEGPVAARDLVAVHADPASRPASADPDDDLAWYATQEIETEVLDPR